MEESLNQPSDQTDEGPETLLSYKIGKINKSPPLTALISSLIRKQQNTDSRHSLLESRSKILKASCSSSFKRLNRKNTPVDCESKKKPQQQIAYKFFRYSTVGPKPFHTIYQSYLPSLDAINETGLLAISDGRLMEGTWVDGVPIKNIKIQYANGIIYYGPVYDYRPHGHGFLYYPDNRKYVGEFCYGDFHGRGIYYDEKDQVKKQGVWDHGKYIGE